MLILRSLRQTTWAAPSQWQGQTEDGRPVQVRYRHGELSVRVGGVDETVEHAVRSPPIFRKECGERLGCQLDWEEVEAFTGIRMLPA